MPKRLSRPNSERSPTYFVTNTRGVFRFLLFHPKLFLATSDRSRSRNVAPFPLKAGDVVPIQQ